MTAIHRRHRGLFIAHEPVNETPKFHVVSVGRLAKEKQQSHLLRAIAASRYKNEITLTLAGTGPQQGHLIDLAAGLGVRAEIGRVSDESLKALYQTADVFVQTSAVELEGLSVPVSRGLSGTDQSVRD